MKLFTTAPLYLALSSSIVKTSVALPIARSDDALVARLASAPVTDNDVREVLSLLSRDGHGVYSRDDSTTTLPVARSNQDDITKILNNILLARDANGTAKGLLKVFSTVASVAAKVTKFIPGIGSAVSKALGAIKS